LPRGSEWLPKKMAVAQACWLGIAACRNMTTQPQGQTSRSRILRTRARHMCVQMYRQERLSSSLVADHTRELDHPHHRHTLHDVAFVSQRGIGISSHKIYLLVWDKQYHDIRRIWSLAVLPTCAPPHALNEMTYRRDSTVVAVRLGKAVSSCKSA
jgi:hypothetical protein